MTNSINLIRGNNGTNLASSPTVTTLRAPGSTTILVNTVTGLPASFIAEMGTPDLVTGLITNGVVFRGHVSSTTLIIDEIGVGYTDAGSAVNDIIVLKPTAEWANNIANVLAVSFNDDGTPNIAPATDAHGWSRKNFGGFSIYTRRQTWTQTISGTTVMNAPRGDLPVGVSTLINVIFNYSYFCASSAFNLSLVAEGTENSSSIQYVGLSINGDSVSYYISVDETIIG